MALVPPYNIETERQLLGALMVRSQLIPEVDSQFKSEDLYLESHRLIYNTILEQNRQGVGDIDAVQISQRLSDLNRLEQSGGSAYILSLAQDVMAPGNALRHCQRVKSLSMRRRLMEAANSILSEAAQPVEDEDIFYRKVEESILRITNEGSPLRALSTAELQREFQLHIQNLLEKKGEISGLSTHFRDLDNLSSGLKKGELLVLAARPGLGKTTFALNIASNIAVQSGEAVLFYSLEMSQIELMMRLVCARSAIEHERLKRGQLPLERQNKLQESIDAICRAPIYIDDSGDLSIWDCMARTRKFKIDLEQQGKKLGLVVVDYLQLISDPEARRFGRQHEVATISRSLKQLARIVQAPVLAVSQMNRSVEQRRGEAARPQLSDLRESGAIEQDADIVMFIHHDQREESENPDDLPPVEEEAINKGTVEIIIAKHRNGPIGSFRLLFAQHMNLFRDTPEITSKASRF